MGIYVDNAATTRLSEKALEAMLPYFREVWGNPSSIHHMGQEAARGITFARETIARLLKVSPRELYFTSCGSEADNQALYTAAVNGERTGKKHIVSTAFEHPAVLRTLENLRDRGFRITLVSPSKSGYIEPDQIEKAICKDTVLVSVMYANNEVGTIQPIGEIGSICREKGIWFHTDAVQAAGHLPLPVKEDCIDMFTISAHKFHGPKGVGLLYAGREITPARIISGGEQERGLRAGTENVAAIAGMAAALEESYQFMDTDRQHISDLRDRLERKLLEISGVSLNGASSNKKDCNDPRLPGISNLTFDGVNGEALLMMLAEKGICASAGSACAAGSIEPSHVLLSMGRTAKEASSSVRFSLGGENTVEEIDTVVETVISTVKLLRKQI